MDEVAQANFRTEVEREEYGGVLPGVEVVRAVFLRVKKRLREGAATKFVEVKLAVTEFEHARRLAG